jgi:hypothetical protein
VDLKPGPGLGPWKVLDVEFAGPWLFRYAVDPGLALGPVVTQGATVANWSWGWMETLATLFRRGLARPVGSDLVGIVPETEIKAFWWLRQTVTFILFLFDGF